MISLVFSLKRYFIFKYANHFTEYYYILHSPNIVGGFIPLKMANLTKLALFLHHTENHLFNIHQHMTTEYVSKTKPESMKEYEKKHVTWILLLRC